MFFCGGEVGGDAFEGVPEYLVAAAAFVDRKDAALEAVNVDAGQQVRARSIDRIGGCWCPRACEADGTRQQQVLFKNSV